MTVMQRIQLGTQLPGLGNRHVRCRQESPAGGSALRVGIRQSAIDRLADHSGDRNAALSRGRRDSLMTLVVEQDLQTMLQWHAHTVA